MSNHSRRRRHTRFTPGELNLAVTLGRTLRGCTCQPIVSHTHAGGLPGLIIAHDDWCPAADAGTQIVVKPSHPPIRRGSDQ